MFTRVFARRPPRTKQLTIVLVLMASVVVPSRFTADGGGFEPHYPTNEQLRGTVLGVWESQTFRPPVALEQNVREALRSIKETEGRANPWLAGHLSTLLKETWTELERSRVVGGLGYTEFDEATFEAAEAKFHQVLVQFVGARAPYPDEQYLGSLKTLADAQALSRTARRPVPGLSSDDVLLAREKRQKLLMKEEESGRKGAGAFIGLSLMGEGGAAR